MSMAFRPISTPPRDAQESVRKGFLRRVRKEGIRRRQTACREAKTVRRKESLPHGGVLPVHPAAYTQDPTIREGAAEQTVSRDNPGATALEQTVIRWAIDSDPQGAHVFYRVLSSIPAVVKNTNETHPMTTPYEETRSFNILGLTYENSRDVRIEIKVVKTGYETQVKRFNVRQALDQQEISSYFMFVPKE